MPKIVQAQHQPLAVERMHDIEREMVRAEIARREEVAATFLPFTFTVDDDPAALTDVTAAVQAIEEERKARTDGVERRASPTIAPSIEAAVEAALAAAHPKQFSRPGLAILSHVIVESANRNRANELAAAQARQDDKVIEYAAERARARLAKMRNAVPR